MAPLYVVYYSLVLQILTAGTSSQRETTKQTCDVTSCPDILHDNLFVMSCTNGFEVGSECSFTCPPYHVRMGESSIQCKKPSFACGAVEWSSRIPYCRVLLCSEPPKVKEATWTCSKNVKLGSVCKYSCKSGYRLVPPDHSGFLCYKNATWIGDPKPCCIENIGPCPPNLKADIAFIMDTSASLGIENFLRTKHFVRETVRLFQLGKDRARFAFIIFSDDIHFEDQVLFEGYENSLKDLLSIIDDIPYFGRGTNLGKALRYANSVVFRAQNGNRPDANDIIFLFTDGASRDRFAFQASRLKRRGVQFYVFAIGLRVKSDVIETTFGDKNNYNIFYFRDYEKLVEFGPSKVLDRLCPYRCFNNAP